MHIHIIFQLSLASVMHNYRLHVQTYRALINKNDEIIDINCQMLPLTIIAKCQVTWFFIYKFTMGFATSIQC